MRLGPSSALVGTCLFLIGPGCASPAYRAGGALGPIGAPVRLLRPADPIARLSPAPVSIGPMYDPGSYTAASPAAVAGAARPAPGQGPLTVGGGQLADRGARSAARGPDLAERGGSPAERAGIASSPSRGGPASSRPPADLARNAPNSGAMADELGPDGWPILRGAETGTLAGSGDEAGRLSARSDRGSGGEESEGGRNLGREARAAVEGEARSRIVEAPMLAAGIDLETYATPPRPSDPDTRLVSARRPVAALRDSRAAIQSKANVEADDPDPSRRPRIEASDSADEPEIPDLSELPGDAEPGSEPADGTFRGEERPPARDDLRPTAMGSDLAARDHERSGQPPRVAPDRDFGGSSPFERSRLRDRVGARVRQLGERLVPRRLGFERPAGSGPAFGDGWSFRMPRLTSGGSVRGMSLPE